MAEKLISCNWVDPRQGRQGQQRCWLGMGHQWLSRTGVLVSAGMESCWHHGQCQLTAVSGVVPVQWGIARCCFPGSPWGSLMAFCVLMVPLSCLV